MHVSNAPQHQSNELDTVKTCGTPGSGRIASTVINMPHAILQSVISRAGTVDVGTINGKSVGCGLFKNLPCFYGGSQSWELDFVNLVALRRV
jgi:hypothetical protein